MAKTPYGDLKSEDILSAHISGLQHSVNKIEEVLNMKTQSVTGHTLVPVTDQDDPSLRYRIYEGTIRGWLDNPAPVIYRNGEVVPASEYVISPGHGVVVFHSQQISTDVITADFTHVIAESTRIEGVEADISTLQTDVSTLQTNVSGLQTDVSDIQSDLSVRGYGQQFPLNGSRQSWVNVMPGKTEADLTPSDNILMAAGTIDAMPIFIETRTTISRMRVDINANSVQATMIMGIYSDVNAQPGELLASTDAFTTTTGQNIVPLSSPITLDVGVYWIARYQSAGVRIDGHKWNNAVHITFAPVSASLMNGSGDIVGVRTASLGTSLTSLPNPFPAVGSGASDSKYLARTDLGTIYALK
jgi:hypothetical protein